MDGVKTQILVIGGGAAGMMAAIKAASLGCDVVLLEKNLSCGRKICLTGKGRCNLTNTKKWSEFATHIHPVANFVRPAFYNFNNEQTMAFFEAAGLPLSVERGERVFPKSMKASDVPKALVSQMERLGVRIVCGADVNNLEFKDGAFRCSYFKADGRLVALKLVFADAVIIATGGLSYPSTGSTGWGLEMARKMGITVEKTFPSLTALMPVGYDTDLEGLNLENVGITLLVDNSVVQLDQGDLSFTGNGIEGSLGYRVSRRAVKAMDNGQKVVLLIDLKPALSIEQLNRRVQRELAGLRYTSDALGISRMRELLRTLLPRQAVTPFVNSNRGLTVSNLPDRLKEWRFSIASYTGYERAVVTAGGVSQKEIVAKNMMSRKIDGLFFAGEVIDIDGDTGGYNLQMAFSTGVLAGQGAARKVLGEKNSRQG